MREHETRPTPRVIDFHTHAFPPWLRDRRDRYLETDATFGDLFSNPRAKMSTADELVEAMDADGVDASVVMGMGWTDHGLAVEGQRLPCGVGAALPRQAVRVRRRQPDLG